jgi:hypothetical protein
MTKVYESVKQAEASSHVRELEAQCAQWKDRANRFREPAKVRFCERRMMNYKKLLDEAMKA